MFAAEQIAAPQCLVGYKHLVTTLAAADRTPPYVNPVATCDAELSVAASYDRALTVDGPRERIASALASARAAQARGDLQTCRQAVGAVRQTYFDAVYGGPDSVESTVPKHEER
jgi:hypothetical protein